MYPIVKILKPPKLVEAYLHAYCWFERNSQKYSYMAQIVSEIHIHGLCLLSIHNSLAQIGLAPPPDGTLGYHQIPPTVMIFLGGHRVSWVLQGLLSTTGGH